MADIPPYEHIDIDVSLEFDLPDDPVLIWDIMDRESTGDVIVRRVSATNSGNTNTRTFSRCKINTFELNVEGRQALAHVDLMAESHDSGVSLRGRFGKETSSRNELKSRLHGTNASSFSLTVNNNVVRSYRFVGVDDGVFPMELSSGRQMIYGRVVFESTLLNEPSDAADSLLITLGSMGLYYDGVIRELSTFDGTRMDMNWYAA